jgi:VWFA-related protein
MKPTASVCLIAICWSTFAQPPAQSPAQPQAPQSGTVTLHAGTNEVLLDVVVRDKKGQRVTNLENSDLEILDNGVPQKITSLRLIEGDQTIATPEQASGAPKPVNQRKKSIDVEREIRLVTLIFNRLDLNARTIARTAALDLLKNEFPQNVYMGVLVLGDSLQALQPFTNDIGLLRKAVEHATSGAYTEFISDSARIEKQMQEQLGPATAGESVGEQVQEMADGASGSGGKGPTGDPAGAAMAQLMLNMLMLSRTSELAQTGRSAIWGLIDAVSQQYRLPGRKSILFFSSGFGVPQGMEEPWKVLISTANRFNVTFYSIDARGLNTMAMNQQAVSELKDATSASRANLRKGNGLVTPAMAQVFDTAINSGKENAQDTLADLAQSTGGFLIANTNDFRDQLKKVSEDIETYYQVTYDPRIEKYDGTFHKIEVRSARAGLRIQARSGYFALPPSTSEAGVILAPYELPLMQSLSAGPLPRDFAFQSTGMHFRGTNNEPEVSVVLDVPIGNLTLQQAAPAGPYEGGLAYIALVRNASGEVVHRLRGEVPLAATPEQLDAFKESHFIYQEHLALGPGRYTLETALSDKAGKKSSARKSVFVVPKAGVTLGLSSVTLVRTIRDKNENSSSQDPFLIAGKLVTPSISPSFKKASTTGLSFYFVVYPDKAESSKPELSMQFSRDGEPLGGGSPALTDPDAAGRIQYIATVPIDKMQPGNYQVVFRARQGAEVAQESVTFSLE